MQLEADRKQVLMYQSTLYLTQLGLSVQLGRGFSRVIEDKVCSHEYSARDSLASLKPFLKGKRWAVLSSYPVYTMHHCHQLVSTSQGKRGTARRLCRRCAIVYGVCVWGGGQFLCQQFDYDYHRASCL